VMRAKGDDEHDDEQGPRSTTCRRTDRDFRNQRYKGSELVIPRPSSTWRGTKRIKGELFGGIVIEGLGGVDHSPKKTPWSHSQRDIPRPINKEKNNM